MDPEGRVQADHVIDYLDIELECERISLANGGTSIYVEPKR